MSDELLVEDVEISEQELQLICPEDGEVQESEESKYGYRTSIIVNDGISTSENPVMLICTPADHLFRIDAEDWPRISGFKWYVSSDGGGRMYVYTYVDRRRSTCTASSLMLPMTRGSITATGIRWIIGRRTSG